MEKVIEILTIRHVATRSILQVSPNVPADPTKEMRRFGFLGSRYVVEQAVLNGQWMIEEHDTGTGRSEKVDGDDDGDLYAVQRQELIRPERCDIPLSLNERGVTMSLFPPQCLCCEARIQVGSTQLGKDK